MQHSVWNNHINKSFSIKLDKYVQLCEINCTIVMQLQRKITSIPEDIYFKVDYVDFDKKALFFHNNALAPHIHSVINHHVIGFIVDIHMSSPNQLNSDVWKSWDLYRLSTCYTTGATWYILCCYCEISVLNVLWKENK